MKNLIVLVLFAFLFCFFVLFVLNPPFLYDDQLFALLGLTLVCYLADRHKLLSTPIRYILCSFEIAAVSLSFDEMVKFGFQFADNEKNAMLQYFCFKVFFGLIGGYAAQQLFNNSEK